MGIVDETAALRGVDEGVAGESLPDRAFRVSDYRVDDCLVQAVEPAGSSRRSNTSAGAAGLAATPRIQDSASVDGIIRQSFQQPHRGVDQK